MYLACEKAPDVTRNWMGSAGLAYAQEAIGSQPSDRDLPWLAATIHDIPGLCGVAMECATRLQSRVTTGPF